MKLNEGVIKGHVATIPQSVKKFYAFQQIPYAAPPVGKLRFQVNLLELGRKIYCNF
jgi:carboxylesterase type B